MRSSGQPLLAINQIGIKFGGLHALQAVSLDVAHHEIVGLIGPNGAGKTTLFNIITRLYTPHTDEIRFDGQNALAWAPHEVISHGIARTFQNLLLFGYLSVLDNVLIGAHSGLRAGLVACAFNWHSAKREDRAAVNWCREVLDVVGLGSQIDQAAQNLSFGHQRLLELARALASRPRLLLLDEPGAGLNAQELDQLVRTIRRVHNEWKLSILMIAHTMRLIMTMSDRIVVLDHGVKIADGLPAEIRVNPAVIDAYLGQAQAHAPP